MGGTVQGEKGEKLRTGKSGGSDGGVHGGGGARAAAPLVPAPPHRAQRWVDPSHALSPLLVPKLPASPRPCSFGSPSTAACACGRGLWTGEAASGWAAPEEAARPGFA